MIVSLWKKNERFNTLMVYGLLAFKVFNIVENYIESNNQLSKSVKWIQDPTGLIKLMIKIVEVVCLGISMNNKIFLCFLNIWIHFFSLKYSD